MAWQLKRYALFSKMSPALPKWWSFSSLYSWSACLGAWVLWQLCALRMLAPFRMPTNNNVSRTMTALEVDSTIGIMDKDPSLTNPRLISWLPSSSKTVMMNAKKTAAGSPSFIHSQQSPCSCSSLMPWLESSESTTCIQEYVPAVFFVASRSSTWPSLSLVAWSDSALRENWHLSVWQARSSAATIPWTLPQLISSPMRGLMRWMVAWSW